jgi:hypothetical protein
MKDDPLLTSAEAGARCVPPMSGAALRSRVSKGVAPKPDVPDTDRSPRRRQLLWRASTIDAWNAVRRPPGRPVKSDPELAIVRIPGATRYPWAVVDRRSGDIIERFALKTRAHDAYPHAT